MIWGCQDCAGLWRESSYQLPEDVQEVWETGECDTEQNGKERRFFINKEENGGSSW